MTNILTLMQELNLSEETVLTTIVKINTICGTTNCSSTRNYTYIMDGNGDGNN